MRKSGEKHSKRKRAKRNSFFAVIFMLIIFSFCSCGKTTETTSSDLEEEIPEEETEGENFSKDKQVYSEDDEQEDPMADAGQDMENGAESDSRVKEDTSASDGQVKEDMSASDGQVKEDTSASVSRGNENIPASGSRAEEDTAASDNRTKEEPIITESQTNDASVTSESAEMPRGSEGGNIEEPAEVVAGTDYILNMNTKKFHYPDCSSVGQMAEKNKWAYTGNRDDVIAMGYVPCKRCNP